MAAADNHSSSTAAEDAAPGAASQIQKPRPRQSLKSALIRYGLLFALLPNLPFWLIAPRMGIVTPGLFNLDVLLLGILSLVIAPAWLIGLYAADFLLGVVYGIRATYGVSYVEIFYSLTYGFAVLSARECLTAAAAAVLIIAIVALAWLYGRPRLKGRDRVRFAAIILGVIIPVAAFASVQRARATARQYALYHSGTIILGGMAPRFTNIASSVLRSPALSLYHAWSREHIWGWLHGEYSQTVFAPSAASHATAWLGGKKTHPNLVVVLTESWGLANDPALRGSLVAPFQSRALRQRYHLQQGTVGFSGHTAEGELREICNYRLAVAAAPLSISHQALAGCLPWTMQRAGYDTLALDSAMRYWPGGASWYRLMGFQHTMNFDDFHRLNMATFAYSPFRSIRDPDVAAWIAGELSRPQPRPQMIFWLTVSAHLPLRQPLPAEYSSNCSIAPVTQTYPQACAWYKVEHLTLQSIAAMASAPRLAPTVFLVVGDHAPPFVSGARQGFSPTAVPYLLLTPLGER